MTGPKGGTVAVRHSQNAKPIKRDTADTIDDVTVIGMEYRASADRRVRGPLHRRIVFPQQRRQRSSKAHAFQSYPLEILAGKEEQRPRSVEKCSFMGRSPKLCQVDGPLLHPLSNSLFHGQRSSWRPQAASFDDSAGVSAVSSSDGAEAQIYDLPSAKVLVETSMLASVSGVCQLLLGILRLDAYMHYLLPFPLVLAAVRSGPVASRKTLIATFFLTIVLLGPPRAVSYVLLYGVVGLTLGFLWHLRSPWWLTWISCTFSYVGGMFCYIYVAGFLLKENLFKLVTYNVYVTVTKIASTCGVQASPSASMVIVALLAFLMLRGLIYTHILQLCYALLLSSMVPHLSILFMLASLFVGLSFWSDATVYSKMDSNQKWQ